VGYLFLLLVQKLQAYFRYQLVSVLPSVMCSRRLIEMDKPHILASAAETDFCNLMSKFPLNLKIKYQWFNVNERPLD
jgi:hypothetical protein